ncbi:MAG: 1-acyl-sn-glycerol-3-phosphate acyltransferase [Chitinophagaceae bacterium]|jgi:1-acyl-sn-glycerol-3-phosphate acyltransferase|nr:1-acyl-sn-glycerol-3-phosphate acyltransferase [Chitinophagaceae bacterium]
MPSVGEWIADSKLIKGPVYSLVGMASWPGLNVVNKTEISGMEHLADLPRQNVLFVSNHQTYFADVITFLHIFCARRWGRQNKLGLPYYLLWPFTRVKFIAAEETMKSNLLSRLFALAGAISVKRTWRAKGHDVQRNRDENDTQKIDEALARNWVITFPQGTTKPFAPGRKGTAHIIKNNRPIVVPVVINGFWRAFDKKGLRFKKKGATLSVTFKQPLQIDYDAPADKILEQVMDAIEQSKQYMLKGKHHLMNVLDK